MAIFPPPPFLSAMVNSIERFISLVIFFLSFGLLCFWNVFFLLSSTAAAVLRFRQQFVHAYVLTKLYMYVTLSMKKKREEKKTAQIRMNDARNKTKVRIENVIEPF